MHRQGVNNLPDFQEIFQQAFEKNFEETMTLATHDDIRNFIPPADCLKGKNILVTGAGDGIGKAAALSYAKYGATVLLLGKTASKLEAVYDLIEAEGGAEPAMLLMNLESASYTEMQQLAILIEREVGHLDGVLHNAGLLGVLTPLEMYDPIIFEQVMKVNFRKFDNYF